MKRRILAAVDDLFFASKIRAAAGALDVDLSFVRTLEQLKTSLTEKKADLIIVDLHSQKVDPLVLGQTVKADEKLSSIQLLGFFSHVEAELQRTAIKAGYDKVIPRSVFSRDLVAILSGDTL